MKASGLAAALALLVVSNAWLLIHVAANRAGTPDSQLELTSRELIFHEGSSEDSSATLTLRWQNLAPQYQYLVNGVELPGWFDERKLSAIGFDTRLPADAEDADRYYRNQRSRDVYVALELEGPSWQQWLAMRERQLRMAPASTQSLTPEQQLRVERESESRLVAVDASADPVALRRAHPDRQRVLILPGIARVVREGPRVQAGGRQPSPAMLRGAIVRIAIEQINVPVPLSRELTGWSSVAPWTLENGELKIPPASYAVTLSVGSRYEPWVTAVKHLR